MKSVLLRQQNGSTEHTARIRTAFFIKVKGVTFSVEDERILGLTRRWVKRHDGAIGQHCYDCPTKQLKPFLKENE